MNGSKKKSRLDDKITEKWVTSRDLLTGGIRNQELMNNGTAETKLMEEYDFIILGVMTNWRMDC